ncbi:hypothetical protein Lfu02_69520 [Longispora fulva]|uniref:Uncharacterized protein n=1 Tax=Longispora fulva TaxID=619741 RepID=A0A8J7KG34_9ACTN|nr:hypothetical protein [Longispora fulva]MBG6134509.1 hypothetical protein [Longispora fulva]GIG62580.1 hypothetical protein Lfu02_69520 [Longispora fulva]
MTMKGVAMSETMRAPEKTAPALWRRDLVAVTAVIALALMFQGKGLLAGLWEPLRWVAVLLFFIGLWFLAVSARAVHPDKPMTLSFGFFTLALALALCWLGPGAGGLMRVRYDGEHTVCGSIGRVQDGFLPVTEEQNPDDNETGGLNRIPVSQIKAMWNVKKC